MAVQHHPGVQRGPARHASRRRRTLLLPRPRRRIPRAPPRGNVGRPRRRAHRHRAPARVRRARLPGQDSRRRQARTLQRHLRLFRGAGRALRRPNRGPPREPPHSTRPRVRFPLRARRPHPACGAAGLRPFDAGHPRRGGEQGHPLYPAQRAVPHPARTGEVPATHPRDDDLDDLRARRRHRGRQEDHEPAARLRRPPGPEKRGGPNLPTRRCRRLNVSGTRWSRSRSTATTGGG